jgi:glycosyltransferase involved in cell wall biosynthesis
MRILQLVDSLQYGGAEQVVATLSIGLRALGHEVLVVSLRDFGTESVGLPQLQRAGVEMVALDKPPGPHFASLRHIRRLVRDERTDLINTHNHLVHHYGLAAGRAAGIPVVNTVHGIDTLSIQFWAGLIYRGCCWISDSIISVCEPVKEELSRRYGLPERKLAVVQNGIDLERFLRVPSREPREEVVFGTVGRLVPVKDHHNLLRAFAELLPRNRHCRLKFLGSGPLKDELESAASGLGIAHAVEFRGFSSDVPGFLNELDVFVLPSRSEGLPLTLIEAMASGLPAIATKVGGIPSVLTSGGWLCPPQDSRQLALAMEEALKSDLSNVGAQARQRSRAYSSDNMVSQYLSLYASLIHRPSSTDDHNRTRVPGQLPVV